jgi:PBP1b-binding outer membrane lipoprotein LpoB
MNTSIAMILSAAALFLAGCSAGPSGLETVDNSQRGAASYAPDYSQHLNNPFDNSRTSGIGRY